MNRFSLPDNLQEESEAFQFPGLFEKTATMKNKSYCTSKPQRNKILIPGDSHARGYATELSNSLVKTFEIIGAEMSGSRSGHITRSLHREISQLHRDDFAIICGGANDIIRDESNIGLRHIRKFVF